MSRTRTAPPPSDYPSPLPRALLAPRHWGTWLGLGLARLLAWAPWPLRRRLGAAVGNLAYRRRAKRRRIVQTNLAWCFPGLSAAERDAMARRYFQRLFQTLFDYGLLWWGGERRLGRLLELEGEAHLTAQQAAGRPVILLTCHNVALDFGAAALTRRHRAVGLIKPARNPLVDWWMARGRTRFHGILYRREQGLRPVIGALRAGYAFYYLPDEDLGPERSVFVPFFGVPAATIDALPRLARVSGAAVLPFATRYLPEEGRYVATISPPLEGFPSGDDTADAARMNAELERMVRQAPDQYMWSFKIFRTRPGGEKGPY